MRLIGIALCAVALPAQAAPIAIRCAIHTVQKSKNYGTTPDGTVEKDISVIFVIDDAAKSLKRYNDQSAGIEDWCSACKLTFGGASISYYRWEDGKRAQDPTVVDTFTLDRMKGTVKWSYHHFGVWPTGGFFDHETDWDGRCVKAPMPNLKPPAAKF